MLSIENVQQTFRSGFLMHSKEILHGVTFQVPKGSIFGFLGPNGAGKTTLIHLIVGIRAPTRGHVKIKGFPARSLEAKRLIGYLPERPYFQEHLTGEGLLRYFGSLAGMTREELGRRIPEALESVGMSQARKVELGNYSKGMLQRIGIAQAILHHPELLVLDEPMSGLDPIGRKEIRELIVSLARQGRTLFFSSHVIPDVEAICDQVAVIDRGKMQVCGPISDFLSEKSELQFELILRCDTRFEDLLSGVSLGGDFMLDGLRWGQLPEDRVRVVVSGERMAERFLQLIASESRYKLISFNPIRPSLESLFSSKVSVGKGPNELVK